MFSFLQSQERKSRCTLQINGPSGQPSVPTVAGDRCVGKSNKRVSKWTFSPNTLLSPHLFSGWGFPGLDIICSFNSCQRSSLLKYS